MRLSIHLDTCNSSTRPCLSFAPDLHCILCPVHYSNHDNSSDWVVDSSTSHHVTTDLHEPYTASDHVLIGDGTGLSIANTGSFTLPSIPTPLLFTNVLHVPAKSKNLIAVSALCADNSINVLFFLFFSGVGSSHRGHFGSRTARDNVYYWPKLVPPRSSTLALSSSVRSSFSAISMWQSHLGHLSLHIFHKFLSVLNISFLDDHLCSFSCTSYNINKSHKLPFSKSSIISSSPLNVIFSDVRTSPV